MKNITNTHNRIFRKLGTRRNFLNQKTVSAKADTAKITSNDDSFPLRWKIYKDIVSSILIKIRLEILSSAISQEKEIKNIKIEKKK